MYGYIYKTTNKVNGKIYIGQHKAEKFEPGIYVGSGSILKKAIKKYGRASFECECLKECNSKEELDQQEKYWIEFFSSRDPNLGYNIVEGGFGGSGPMKEETKQKIAKWNSERTLVNDGTICFRILKEELPDYLAKGYKYGPLPFTRSDEFKQKVKLSNTGKIGMHRGAERTRVSPDQLEYYLREGYEIGWVNPEDKKIRQNKTIPGEGKCKYMNKDNIYKLVPESEWNRFIAEGWVFGNKKRTHKVNRKKGYKLSAEHIQHLREAHLGVKMPKDRIERHSAKIRGRVYMHLGLKVKLIPRGEESSYLAQGWVLGRPKKNVL